MKKTFLVLAITLTIFTIDGSAGPLIPVQHKNGLWGYVDSENSTKYVIQPTFEDAFPFVDSRARVKIAQKYGFIDKSGSIIIKPIYDSATDYNNGFSLCCLNGRFGILDTIGNCCLPFDYSEIKQSNGCSFFEGMISGRETVDIIKLASPICSIKTIKKLGAVSNEEGYRYAVLTDNTYNVISPNGDLVFEKLVKDTDSNYYRGIVVHDDCYYILRIDDIDSKPVVYKFKEIIDIDGLIIGMQAKKKGVLDNYYHFIIPDEYEEINTVGRSFIACKVSDGQYRLFDRYGGIVLDDITSIKNNNNNWSLYQNKDGHTYLFTIDSDDCITLQTHKKSVPIIGKPSSITHCNGLTLYQTNSNFLRVVDTEGNQLWGNLNISSIIPLYNGYYAIATFDEHNYLLAHDNGKVYSYSFYGLKHCNKEGFFKHLHNAKPRYLDLRGSSPLSLSEFNYNSFCSFYDIDKNRYGKMDESFKIILPATLQSEPDVPCGNKWIKGSSFFGMVKLPFGGYQGVDLVFPKGDLDLVVVICFEAGNYIEASINANLGAEEYRKGFTYTINGNIIDIIGYCWSCSLDSKSRSIVEPNGTIYSLISTSYEPPIYAPDTIGNGMEAISVIHKESGSTDEKLPEEFKLPNVLINNPVPLDDNVLLQINTVPDQASVSIDGSSFIGQNSISSSIHNIQISKDKYEQISYAFKPVGPSSLMTFELPRQYQQKYAGYFNVGYQFHNYSAVCASLGGYISNFNIEGAVGIGLNSSEHLYWNTPEGYSPSVYSYSPASYFGKVGYGVIIGRRFRITPQVGLGIITLNGKKLFEGLKDPGATHAYQLSSQVDLKIDFAITPWLGIYAIPIYSFPINSSTLYSRLSEVSSVIHEYGNGYNTQIGISFIF